MLADDREDMQAEYIRTIGSKYGFVPNFCSVNSMESILMNVENGLGVTVCNSWVRNVYTQGFQCCPLEHSVQIAAAWKQPEEQSVLNILLAMMTGEASTRLRKLSHKSYDTKYHGGGTMAKILVVDDEVSIRMGIREFAEYQGYEVEEAANGKEAVERCRQKDFDVIIMDIMMPEMDGYEAYKKIREIKDIPALMLSAKGEEYDKLQGFELGIDDYVVKPFSIRELMARIGVILQRNQKNKKKTETEGTYQEVEKYEFEGLSVNVSAREVFVDGVRVELRPKEYDLLFFLVRNRGIVFSRDALLEKVWGFDFMGDDRTVDAQIKMLRHALGGTSHLHCNIQRGRV